MVLANLIAFDETGKLAQLALDWLQKNNDPISRDWNTPDENEAWKDL